MSIQTILKCDRCEKESPVRGNVDDNNLVAFDWRKLFDLGIICPDCIKDLIAWFKSKPAGKRDSGFTDGRPVAK